MTTVVLCILSACLLGGVVVVFILRKENKKLQKEMKEQEKEYAEESKSKNKVKESLDTGNSSADFDTSLNILHNLADYD